MQATPEQAAGITMTLALQPGEIGVGNAYAGTGKTTTAALISAEAHKIGWRVLYVCFNAAMAEEARSRFPTSVTCKTAHSLAYAIVGYRYAKAKLRDGSPKLGSVRLADVRRITGLAGYEAMDVLDGLNNFLASTEGSPGLEHLATPGHSRAKALSHLVALWRAMVDINGDVPITHDGYLKLWINDCPNLPYDLLIVDEAQDLNPVLLDLIEQQAATRKRVLLIGDTHQSIYGFRKATNAMSWAADRAAGRFSLTESWRFGPATARAASVLLTDYKADPVAINGRGPKMGLHNTTCILARSNGSLLKRALSEVTKGGRIHFAATSARENWSPRVPYKFTEFEDAALLYLGRSAGALRSPLIRQFATWGELSKAGESDPELESVKRFVTEVGAIQIPIVLEQLIRAGVGPDQAKLHFSSAHRSKGKEWTRVELLNDFPPLDNPKKIAEIIEDKGAEAFAEEINLLYVAITRGCAGFTAYESAANYFRRASTPVPSTLIR
jgi:hypothetical protein